MGVLLKDEDFHAGVISIAENYEQIDNNFELSLKDIYSIIDAKGKVKYDKTEKLLYLYNAYYQTNITMEDLYNTNYIKDYLLYLNQNQAIYGDEGQSSFLDKFFSFTNAIKSYFSKVFKNKNTLLVKDKKILTIIVLIMILVLWFIINNSK